MVSLTGKSAGLSTNSRGARMERKETGSTVCQVKRWSQRVMDRPDKEISAKANRNYIRCLLASRNWDRVIDQIAILEIECAKWSIRNGQH